MLAKLAKIALNSFTHPIITHE